MAIPKNLKGKIAILALEDAEKDLASVDDTDEDEAEAEDDCICPKCGHSGPVAEFK
jgi:hypothetical protein